MRRADFITFNHFTEFPTGHNVGNERSFSRLRTMTLATSLPSRLTKSSPSSKRPVPGRCSAQQNPISDPPPKFCL